MKQKESIMQASKSIGAGYGYRLSEEAGKLKGQRDNGGAYSLSDRAADYVRAYGNLYDEIVQGYKDGTAERYVEDEDSETGFRKMTLDEELAGLDKAFRKMADGAGVEEMISGEFKRLASKAGSRQTAFMDVNKKLQGTMCRRSWCRWLRLGRMPIRFPVLKRVAYGEGLIHAERYV